MKRQDWHNTQEPAKNRNNLIFESKIAASEEKLDSEVEDAIRQIHKKRYYLGMPGEVVLVGLAFWAKVPKGRIEVIDNGPDGTAMLGQQYRGLAAFGIPAAMPECLSECKRYDAS